MLRGVISYSSDSSLVLWSHDNAEVKRTHGLGWTSSTFVTSAMESVRKEVKLILEHYSQGH